MSLLYLTLAAATLSFGMTWVVRRYASTWKLIDVPNERSSHAVVTARGGGLAIVLVFVSLLPALYVLDELPRHLLSSIAAGGGLVAIIGFIDDLSHIEAHWRLLIHFLAAILAVASFGLGGATIVTADVGMPWLMVGIAIVGMVWLINLYNFMDGIDGIAGIEAITVSLGGALVFYIADPDSHVYAVPTILFACVTGFLYWNYPPASIFMGDVGSGFIGFVLALFCLQAASIGAEVFWPWLILLGVFVVDSGVTLARRLLRGERLYKAHRSHAYQFASRRYGAHAPVSLAVGAINVFWLLPLALLVAFSLLDWRLGLLVAYVPLLCLAFKYQSGAREHPER